MREKETALCLRPFQTFMKLEQWGFPWWVVIILAKRQVVRSQVSLTCPKSWQLCVAASVWLFVLRTRCWFYCHCWCCFEPKFSIKTTFLLFPFLLLESPCMPACPIRLSISIHTWLILEVLMLISGRFQSWRDDDRLNSVTSVPNTWRFAQTGHRRSQLWLWRGHCTS